VLSGASGSYVPCGDAGGRPVKRARLQCPHVRMLSSALGYVLPSGGGTVRECALQRMHAATVRRRRWALWREGPLAGSAQSSFVVGVWLISLLQVAVVSACVYLQVGLCAVSLACSPFDC
jgi:hypothetical protein